LTGERKKLVGIEQSMYSRGEIPLELIESTILEPIEKKYFKYFSNCFSICDFDIILNNFCICEADIYAIANVP
jgi:hypothetical protein